MDPFSFIKFRKLILSGGSLTMKVNASDKCLEYSGRIDFSDMENPLFIFPCSYVKIRFKGQSIKATISNKHGYWDNFIGVICDGRQKKICIYDQDNPSEYGLSQTITLEDNLGEGEHELMLFKRQDSCHVFKFGGFEIEGNEDKIEVLACGEKPHRRIEVYGDSVSAGEVSEAVEFVGKPDPEWHKGEFSNSYYSYSWMTARKLNAQIHDVAQGGIALMDDTGWYQVNYDGRQYYMGMESVYDKLLYNPEMGEVTEWDFNRYRPHVVIVAIGQNDNHPVDYMAEDYNCEKAVLWREKYFKFIKTLRSIYPSSEIILATTILEHDDSWDKSIEEVKNRLADEKVHHFLYSKNGCGTPGHIRRPEAEMMSDELAAFIEGLGEDIWRDEV